MQWCHRFTLDHSGTLDEVRRRLRDRVKEIHAASVSEEEAGGVSTPVRATDQLSQLIDALMRLSPQGSDHEEARLRGLTNDIGRWNLRFDGDEGEGVNLFLERADAFKEYKRVSDEEMWGLVPEMIGMKVTQWLRANLFSISSWGEFKREIRRAYLPVGYDIRLKKDMFARTQGEGERVNEYITVLRTMNARLENSLEEGELLSLALDNLHPFYLTKITSLSIHSFTELVSVGAEIEARQERCKLYRPPPRPNEMVDREFGYVPTAEREVQGGTNATKAENCWRCGKTGHVARSCPEPRKSTNISKSSVVASVDLN